MKTLSLLALLVAGAALGDWSPATDNASEPTTVRGSFHSTRGVMDPLSCHCFDGGYLTLDDGEKVAVCFENGELEAAEAKAEKGMACTELEVTGEMVEHTQADNGVGPCPGGTVHYLRVASFKCL